VTNLEQIRGDLLERDDALVVLSVIFAITFLTTGFAHTLN
jgi:hypothetical protein